MAKTGQQIKNNNITRDGSGIAVQTGGGILTADVTGSPQTSPLAYTTGVVTIVVPDNAIEMIVSPTTDLRVGEALAMTQYDIVRAGSKEVIPCAGMQNIYFQKDAINGTLYFRFHTL